MVFLIWEATGKPYVLQTTFTRAGGNYIITMLYVSGKTTKDFPGHHILSRRIIMEVLCPEINYQYVM